MFNNTGNLLFGDSLSLGVSERVWNYNYTRYHPMDEVRYTFSVLNSSGIRYTWYHTLEQVRYTWYHTLEQVRYTWYHTIEQVRYTWYHTIEQVRSRYTVALHRSFSLSLCMSLCRSPVGWTVWRSRTLSWCPPSSTARQSRRETLDYSRFVVY